MRNAGRIAPLLGAAALLSGILVLDARPTSAAPGAVPGSGVVTGEWQHRRVKFSYFGITSLFTCDGLEERVRRILLHVGARKDVKVTASGCPRGPDWPSHNAWIDTDFYALAPLNGAAPPDGAGAPSLVDARWIPLELTPRRPNFMGEGDCELVQAMKDLLIKNFSLRDVEYRTSCVPHELTLDGFAVKGESLKATPPGPSAVKD